MYMYICVCIYVYVPCERFTSNMKESRLKCMSHVSHSVHTHTHTGQYGKEWVTSHMDEFCLNTAHTHAHTACYRNESQCVRMSHVSYAWVTFHIVHTHSLRHSLCHVSYSAHTLTMFFFFFWHSVSHTLPHTHTYMRECVCTIWNVSHTHISYNTHTLTHTHTHRHSVA